VGNLQDCFLQQIEPVPQYNGKTCNQELKFFLGYHSKEANVMNIKKVEKLYRQVVTIV